MIDAGWPGPSSTWFRVDHAVHRRCLRAAVVARSRRSRSGLTPQHRRAPRLPVLPGRRGTPAAPTCSSRPSPPLSTGDVLVIDNGGRLDEGCIGDLVVGEALMSGLAGTVCWGTHRDTGAILAMGAKVWSLGTCPNGPLELRRASRHRARQRPTSARSPSRIDDYVFADDDGVVVVAAADLESHRRSGAGHRRARRRAGRTAAQGRAAANAARPRRDTSRSASADPNVHVPRPSQDIWRSDRDLRGFGRGQAVQCAPATR